MEEAWHSMSAWSSSTLILQASTTTPSGKRPDSTLHHVILDVPGADLQQLVAWRETRWPWS